ncbi:ATP-binding protein [Streptomyces sp. TP-A0874]|uniref:ATP-binding protein n=1 Tax=Streptomyces sp. TP-A0874 TaxID=549819 RepID=UPI0008535ADC|nr:ATP-binding protein [Streptomyces sp. TP-A0874]
MVVVDSSRTSTAEARRVTAEFLSTFRAWVDIEAVVLVVSELVANAAQHTAGWWRLCLWVNRERLVVDVEDLSRTAPVPRREPDLSGAGGLGLLMVERLAGGVEVLPRPDGKTVRATWSLSGPGAL